jgi:voltage-dependent potassium channel beta subunit
MRYRKLGNSGLKISEIALGGWLTFGNAVEDEAAREIIATAFDLGINFFDTANVYAQGKCEEFLGAALASRPRSSYVLATKVFFPMGEGPNDRGLSRKHIHEQCEASLARLNMEYIDLYQCHRFDEETPVEETIRAMDDLVRRGRICYWGFSEWTASQIRRAVDICRAGGYAMPISSQPQYNLLARGIERAVIPVCTESGIGQIVWSPLAQGLLTGKYKPGEALPNDSRAADPKQNYFIKAKAQDRDLLTRIGLIEPLAASAGITIGQLALAWILRREEISACIVGVSKPTQLVENCRAAKAIVDPVIFARLDELFAN